MSSIQHRVAQLLADGEPGATVTVGGWVRTRRDSKQGFSFIELNDGSSMAGLQVIADKTVPGYEETIKDVQTGSSIRVTGELKESPGAKQRVELHASELELIGTSDAETYPLQKKRHSFEFLREIAHLRPRTNTFGAIARVRNRISYGIHTFFQSRGFLYVHTPIITTSDCEGAGEMFTVTTLLEEAGAESQEPRSGKDADAATRSIDHRPSTIDYSADFFGKRAALTVSGQLEAEIYATSLGPCYTFGPTFRAENSNTTRHLAEFWMIEPEMPFYELDDNMQLAEDFIKYLISDVLEHCADDMEFFNQRIEKTVLETLRHIVDEDFRRISYTEAVDVLTSARPPRGTIPSNGVTTCRPSTNGFSPKSTSSSRSSSTTTRDRSNRSTCTATTTAKPSAPWTCSSRASGRSSVAASASIGSTCLSHGWPSAD